VRNKSQLKEKTHCKIKLQIQLALFNFTCENGQLWPCRGRKAPKTSTAVIRAEDKSPINKPLKSMNEDHEEAQQLKNDINRGAQCVYVMNDHFN